MEKDLDPPAAAASAHSGAADFPALHLAREMTCGAALRG
jgi:hypothetical protein